MVAKRKSLDQDVLRIDAYRKENCWRFFGVEMTSPEGGMYKDELEVSTVLTAVCPRVWICGYPADSGKDFFTCSV